MLERMQNEGKTPPRSISKNDPIYRSPCIKRIPGPLQRKTIIHYIFNIHFTLLKTGTITNKETGKNNCYLNTIV